MMRPRVEERTINQNLPKLSQSIGSAEASNKLSERVEQAVSWWRKETWGSRMWGNWHTLTAKASRRVALSLQQPQWLLSGLEAARSWAGCADRSWPKK